jgi:hypothetical protein
VGTPQWAGCAGPGQGGSAEDRARKACDRSTAAPARAWTINPGYRSDQNGVGATRVQLPAGRSSRHTRAAERSSLGRILFEIKGTPP